MKRKLGYKKFYLRTVHMGLKQKHHDENGYKGSEKRFLKYISLYNLSYTWIENNILYTNYDRNPIKLNRINKGNILLR